MSDFWSLATAAHYYEDAVANGVSGHPEVTDWVRKHVQLGAALGDLTGTGYGLARGLFQADGPAPVPPGWGPWPWWLYCVNDPCTDYCCDEAKKALGKDNAPACCYPPPVPQKGGARGAPGRPGKQGPQSYQRFCCVDKIQVLSYPFRLSKPPKRGAKAQPPSQDYYGWRQLFRVVAKEDEFCECACCFLAQFVHFSIRWYQYDSKTPFRAVETKDFANRQKHKHTLYTLDDRTNSRRFDIKCKEIEKGWKPVVYKVRDTRGGILHLVEDVRFKFPWRPDTMTIVDLVGPPVASGLGPFERAKLANAPKDVVLRAADDRPATPSTTGVIPVNLEHPAWAWPRQGCVKDYRDDPTFLIKRGWRQESEITFLWRVCNRIRCMKNAGRWDKGSTPGLTILCSLKQVVIWPPNSPFPRRIESQFCDFVAQVKVGRAVTQYAYWAPVRRWPQDAGVLNTQQHIF
jgi:hypothetical protein